jgi:hypothetical protein
MGVFPYIVMDNLRNYINKFFDELEVYEDLFRGHSYKVYLRQAILEFLETETKKNAFEVYEAFFDSYRITLEGASNPFIDLLDVLRSYEENAATLIDKQRDHYIHSVNLFILGLGIYIQNARFRAAFRAAHLDKTDYPFSYDTRHEEFFYRWGIASLFHDVGYPIEIIGKQISKFIGFATGVDSKVEVRSHLEFDNFEDFNRIVEVIPEREFVNSYANKYESSAALDLLKPVDLLAHKLHISLGVNLNDIKIALDSFVDLMAKSGFIDHGYFSALIVLKWYGFLIQSCKYKPEYFFYPVLDSASAILLHNYYKNAIVKPPFNRERLSPFDHPNAFLLILCDELQEWNREAYGIVDKKRIQASQASLVISDDQLGLTYLTQKGQLPEGFSEEKEKLLSGLLDLEVVFQGGFCIGCEELSEPDSLPPGLELGSGIVPRPLLDNLEKLAIAIHELYNQNQLERYPDQLLSYPEYSDLPDSLKYSNLRQARGITEKLNLMGLELRPLGSANDVVLEIPEEVVESLAAFEHNEWVRERLNSGWVYGEVKDIDHKVSPYLLPYENLPDDIKDKDRDTIRNIPVLLKMIGFGAYKKLIQR